MIESGKRADIIEMTKKVTKKGKEKERIKEGNSGMAVIKELGTARKVRAQLGGKPCLRAGSGNDR